MNYYIVTRVSGDKSYESKRAFTDGEEAAEFYQAQKEKHENDGWKITITWKTTDHP